MKTKLSLLATAALIGTATGQTVIDITGSTAGRAAVNANVQTLLAPGYTFAFYGSSSTPNRHDAAIFKGTYNGNPVTIRTFWSGSAAGVRDISSSPQLDGAYIVTGQTGSTAGTYLGTVGAAPAGSFAAASAETTSEIGFSDVFQTSTPFQANPLAVEDEVAVIPFKFFANDGSTGITNMTPSAFRNLWGALGEAPLSIFTGNAADSSTTVYATGRNNESGTRITTLAETGTGVFASLNQWGYSSITADRMDGVQFFLNDGGYSSGSNVAQMMAAKSPTSQPGVYVGYIGASDWATATNGGGVELRWNGVPYSTSALYNGQYTFWGYLHQSRMSLSGVSLSFYNDLRTAIAASPGSGLEPISAMNVSRPADGAPVEPN